MRAPLDLSKKKILIVEDNVISYSLLETLLELKGMKCIWVKNGKEAVEYCQKSNPIDLILMDMKMPEMNGYEATRLIKKIRPELPIIAQTAYAIAGDKDKIFEAGCDYYISKPIKKEDLYEKVLTCLDRC